MPHRQKAETEVARPLATETEGCSPKGTAFISTQVRRICKTVASRDRFFDAKLRRFRYSAIGHRRIGEGQGPSPGRSFDARAVKNRHGVGNSLGICDAVELSRCCTEQASQAACGRRACVVRCVTRSDFDYPFLAAPHEAVIEGQCYATSRFARGGPETCIPFK